MAYSLAILFTPKTPAYTSGHFILPCFNYHKILSFYAKNKKQQLVYITFIESTYIY